MKDVLPIASGILVGLLLACGCQSERGDDGFLSNRNEATYPTHEQWWK